MSLKASKKALHKTLINHLTDAGFLLQETISYDVSAIYSTDSIVAHLQVTANVNSRQNGVIPQSKYEIFFCSYGEFKIPKGYDITELKSTGLNEIINILLPIAKKEYERILKSCGIGKPKENEEPLPELSGSVNEEDIAILLSRGDIRIRLSN